MLIMTKGYLICKISDLKYEMRMEEIKHEQAIENKEQATADYYVKKIIMLKTLVNEYVIKLNLG